MMTYGVDTPHIRSYLGTRRIAYEIQTEYDHNEVIIEVLDHTKLNKLADPVEKIIVLTEVDAPASTSWILMDEVSRTVICKDLLVFKSKVIIPGDTDKVRYRYKRRHKDFDVRMKVDPKLN